MISAFDCHSFATLSYYLYQEIQVPSYRKASVDRNIRQKALSRRPSTASLHAKPNTVQEKIFKIEKLPSTHNLVDSNDPLKLINKAVDVSTPKTRFSSQDRCKESTRSCSSPRLKYFPAEKIKKLESPPPFSPKPIGALIAQQDPRECGIVYVAGHPEQCRDTGQGDATAATQHVHEHRQPQVSRYFINFYFFSF